MQLRDRGHPGSRADALRSRGPRASAPDGDVVVATDPASSPRPPSTLSSAELVRAAWHAFPGFLTVFLVQTAFPNEHHRAWRAAPAARALAFPLGACWATELWRLRRGRSRDFVRSNENEGSRKKKKQSAPSRLARLADAFFARALREDERDEVHGTAWYLLGAWLTVCLYPCDVAALSICVLAFGDPAARVAGRGFARRVDAATRRDARLFFSNGKSVVGSAACFLVAFATALVLFRPEVGVFGEKQRRRATDATVLGSRDLAVVCFGAIVGLVAAGVEFLGSAGGRVNDNATIPVLVGAAAWPARGALLGWA